MIPYCKYEIIDGMNNKQNNLGIVVASIVIASSLGYGDVFAESEITLVSEKTVYEPTARIFLTGTIDPEDYFYEPVSIVVYDSNADEIINVQSNVEDNQFSALITGPKGAFESGIYVIEASHVVATNTAKVVIGIDDMIHDTSTLFHMTPLKQIEVGTNPDVVCTDEHVLVQNNHRDSVACVSPATALTLEIRGWGNLF